MTESNLENIPKNLEDVLKTASQLIHGSCTYQVIKKQRNNEIIPKHLEDGYLSAVILDAAKLAAYISSLILYF